MGYANGPATKAPNWHGLVAWDMLFNNLATGLFLVAGLGELLLPNVFTSVATVAYPIALLFLTADLICLVLDLGDPLRFHHMLRVFKPSSPMSLGTWSLTAFSLPLTILAALSFLPGDGPVILWLRRLAVIAGLLPALGSALYKGVLFSTSSQPGWKDARWLGAYLTTSAILLGAAGLLTIAIVMGQEKATATLRVAVALLLLLNTLSLGLLVYDFQTVLKAPEMRTNQGRLQAIVLGGGIVGPLALVLIGMPAIILLAVLLLLVSALVIRMEIVRMPHVFGHSENPEDAPASAANGRPA
jgi:hypothetical protein